MPRATLYVEAQVRNALAEKSATVSMRVAVYDTEGREVQQKRPDDASAPVTIDMIAKVHESDHDC